MARPKKDERDRLDHSFPEMRCSASDLALLEARAKEAVLSRGEYMRRLLRGQQIVVVQSRYDPEEVCELKRIGNNLWQALNAFRAGNVPVPDGLHSAIAKIERHLDARHED